MEEHRYFIYYNRVYLGKTVGQGRTEIACDGPISGIDDIVQIESDLQEEVKNHANPEIRMSVTLVTNFVKF